VRRASLNLLTGMIAVAISGCLGPPVLERQVLGYDGATATLKINITYSPPDVRLPTVYYDGHYYSVNDSVWDRTIFLILSILFQTTIGRIENVGIPITISK
jgi:hypothetical protein